MKRLGSNSKRREGEERSGSKWLEKGFRVFTILPIGIHTAHPDLIVGLDGSWWPAFVPSKRQCDVASVAGPFMLATRNVAPDLWRAQRLHTRGAACGSIHLAS